jgi:hypothetical protein
MDETNQDVVEEIVTPESESEKVDEPQEPQEEAPNEISQEPEYGSRDYNMREMRGIIEQQRRELDEIRASMVEKEVPEPEEDFSDDEIPNVRQVRKLIGREAQTKAEEIIRKKELQDYETKLRSRYKDFDSVVTKENVVELIKGNARLHDRLIKMSKEDPAEANEMVYGLIKQSAFFVDRQRKTSQNETIKKTAKKNTSKPGAGQSVGTGPTPAQQASSFSSLSQEERYKIFQEMESCARLR